jgi:1-acyl-sn-glycerol-3-phosphate acyltransferase
MSERTFHFEDAPELPGADRASKYGFGLIRKAVHRLWDVTVEGVEHIPTDGPAIITPNHLSFCDSVFVPASLPRRVWAVGKGEYMDDWKTKHLFPALGMIPVDRSGGDAAQAALDTAARVLDNGFLFMIYPEGTRSRSGFLHKGRTGASRLALRCSAPVIPVGHEGTLAIQPPDQFTMKPGLPCTVRFGAPMHIEDYGDPADPRIHRVFTDAVMFRISELSGQEYVDVYAAKDDRPGYVASLDDMVEKAPAITVPSGRPSPVTVPSNGSGTAAKEPISVPKGRVGDTVIDLQPSPAS